MESSFKICSKCTKLKADEDFYVHPRGKHGRASICKECSNDRASINRRRIRCGQGRVTSSRGELHGDRKSAAYKRSVFLKKRYGITIKDYNKMFYEQNGSCAICGIHQSKLPRSLSVDHNHKTGKVRQLLCPGCNHGIGHFSENIEFLTNAIEYIKRHNIS